MHRKLQRPSLPTVISLVALFVALGGASYAAVAVKKNAVGPKQIRAEAVRSSEIRDGKVAAADLGDDSVGRDQIQNAAVGTGEVQDGTLNGTDVQNDGIGSQDVAGLLGGDVTPGTFLGGNVSVQFEQAAADLGNGAETSVTVFCPNGQTAIGGGARGDAQDSEDTTVGSSRPVIAADDTGAPVDNETFTGWRATVQNEDNQAGIRPEVWVICATVPA